MRFWRRLGNKLGNFMIEVLMPYGAMLLLLFGMGALLLWAARPSEETPEQRRAVYEAWCDAYERHDIGEDDWQALRAARLLPVGSVPMP